MKQGLFTFLSGFLGEKRERGHRFLTRLWRDEEGSWIIYISMLMPLLIGVAGLGTEAGLLFQQHRSLQNTADAAAYSAALSYSNDSNATNATTQAKAVVTSYGYALGTGANQANVSVNVPVTVPLTAGGTLNAVRVSISRPQSAIFSSVYFPTLSNSATATAVINGGGNSNPSGGCILALGNTSTGNNEPNAIELQGNPTINASNCGIFSNSTDCTNGSFSESLGGSSVVNAGSLGSAGCTDIFGHAQVNLPGGVTCNSSSSTACTQGDGAMTDPYAGTSLPSSPSSCSSALNVTSSTTLSPGRYCGASSIGQGSTINVTLCPGVYIFDSYSNTGTTLNVKHANLTQAATGATSPCTGSSTTTGVTLVFTCSTCTSSLSPPWPATMLAVDSNSTISLSALNTGSTAGFVIMAGPSSGSNAMPLNTIFDTHSNPNTCLLGTIYAPNGEFEYGGTPSSGCGTSSSFCEQLIANTIYLYGNAGFNSGGCSLSGGTGGQIQKPIGASVTLVN